MSLIVMGPATGAVDAGRIWRWGACVANAGWAISR